MLWLVNNSTIQIYEFVQTASIITMWLPELQRAACKSKLIHVNELRFGQHLKDELLLGKAPPPTYLLSQAFSSRASPALYGSLRLIRLNLDRPPITGF